MEPPEVDRRQMTWADVDAIDEAIQFHKTMVSGFADEVVWQNSMFNKTDGITILESAIAESDVTKKDELRRNLEYWQQHYGGIQEIIYQTELPDT